MKKIILVLCFFISIVKINAQQISISDSAVISLITCSPGPETYAKFGHTAIRINDSSNGLDLVFNYGIFSFETANFYWKFIKGETDYQLGVYETGYFLPEYKQRNSAVWEQVLNLTTAEKQNLINLLITNYQPENRVYRYNFIFDNCATRPRDKILAALQGYVQFQPNNESKTFRQWVGVYVGTDTWLKFGIDVIFGLDADKIASQNATMFLPEVLMSEFQNAQIKNFNGQNRKLVSEKKTLVDKNESNEKNATANWLFKPLTISLLLLIIGIIITIWDTKRRRHFKLFDSALLILTGLGGIVIFFLMSFSTHPLVKQNLNILWLNPLNIALGILIWIKSSELRRILFFYQIFNIVLLIGALFAFALSIQLFNVAAFPIIVLMMMRSTRWFAYTKHKLYKRRDLK
ncbi:MAG: DUF4105 domain-containing protein [Paludibacter sp.]